MVDKASGDVILKAMSPREISIIQASFAKLAPIPDRVGARFYNRLFQMAPETRAMFKNDMDEQARKLVLTLATVVDGLDQLETIVPAVEELAIRHDSYGVEDEHYSLVGLALIETLREMLGSGFDGELEQAWRDAYRLISETMIEAVRVERSRRTYRRSPAGRSQDTAIYSSGNDQEGD